MFSKRNVAFLKLAKNVIFLPINLTVNILLNLTVGSFPTFFSLPAWQLLPPLVTPTINTDNNNKLYFKQNFTKHTRFFCSGSS